MKVKSRTHFHPNLLSAHISHRLGGKVKVRARDFISCHGGLLYGKKHKSIHKNLTMDDLISTHDEHRRSQRCIIEKEDEEYHGLYRSKTKTLGIDK